MALSYWKLSHTEQGEILRARRCRAPRAWRVVEEFERAIAEYAGAPHAVAVDSCTNALYLCFKRLSRWASFEPEGLTLPKYTYVGVAQAARNVGFMVDFDDVEWTGEYSVPGTPIVDAARWLRRGMYKPETWTCLSFQASKHLPIGRGGAILCDDEEDAMWFRRARHDGRAPGEDIFKMTEFQFGIHCYMPPPDAARGLWLMASLPDDNAPLPGTYPDLSKVRFT
jgi:dTDP-4-amino-4,6-dideoxygalactose transaminase